MNMYKILKNTTIGAAIVGTLMFGDRAKETDAAQGSTEVMIGHESTTLDVKLSEKLGHGLGFFIRNRATIDYNNKVNMFEVADASYNLVDGLDIVGEAQFSPDAGFAPRLGLQSFNKSGNFTTYLLSTISLKDNLNSETVALIQYIPKISKNVHLNSSLESLTNVGREGHNFSVQRLRLGLDERSYKFGIAVDLLEVGNKAQFNYNIGIFLKRDF